MEGDLRPNLSDTEKQLICGINSNSSSWKNIPFSQARYHLRNFLQERGYHHPIFILTEKGEAKVMIGLPTLVSRVELVGELDEIKISRMRNIVGNKMTPGILDKVEKWITQDLQTRGYACPLVSIQGNPDSGEIFVNIITGKQMAFQKVEFAAIDGSKTGLLERYYPFEMGKLFDVRLLTIAENRISSSSIVESIHYTFKCSQTGVDIKENAISGPPRLLTVGVGLNTEGLLLGKVAWKNSRLGNLSTLLDLSASASARQQILQGTANWYFLPEVSRTYFRPLVQFNHDNEQFYEFVSTSAQFSLATTTDHGSIGGTYSVGPSLDLYRTLRGNTAPTTRLLSLESKVSYLSHLYEYYVSQPQAGYKLNALLDLNNSELLSDVSAQRFLLDGEVLFNLGEFNPPQWIIGIRGGIATLFTGEEPRLRTRLPAPYLQYLGGSTNLRGFGRQELPSSSGLGGLTSLFLGLELRWSNTLPLGIDPFIFTDFGALGTRTLSLDSELYWSPGFGLRWDSPIGPIRTTIAHGYTDSTPKHFQFYLSLGEEF